MEAKEQQPWLRDFFTIPVLSEEAPRSTTKLWSVKFGPTCLFFGGMTVIAFRIKAGAVVRRRNNWGPVLAAPIDKLGKLIEQKGWPVVNATTLYEFQKMWREQLTEIVLESSKILTQQRDIEQKEQWLAAWDERTINRNRRKLRKGKHLT